MPVTIRKMERGLPLMTTLSLKGVEAGNKTVLSEDNWKNWSNIWKQVYQIFGLFYKLILVLLF